MEKSLYSQQHQLLLSLLRQTRADRAVTQDNLSQLIGMKQSDISKVERGVRRLDVIELRSWVIALGMTLPEFTSLLDQQIGAAEALRRQADGRRKR